MTPPFLCLSRRKFNDGSRRNPDTLQIQERFFSRLLHGYVHVLTSPSGLVMNTVASRCRVLNTTWVKSCVRRAPLLPVFASPLEDEMSPKILVPVDGTELAEQVIYRVEADVLVKPGEAEIIIGHVRLPGEDERDRARMTGRLVQQTMVANSRGLRCRFEESDATTIPEGICALAESEHVDMIAMYTDSARPLGERPQGSYSRAVSENTDCEVRVLEASLRSVQD